MRLEREAEQGWPLGGAVGQQVWLGSGQGVGRESEGAAKGAGSAVAGRKDVDVGVAYHDGLCGRDGCKVRLHGAGFGDEGEECVGIGLFGVEAVAAVVLKEEAREAEVVADVAGGVDGLVGEDGHGELGVGSADGFERGQDAGIDVGEVEFVDAVVVEKERNRIGDILLVVDVAFGVSECAADEHGGSIADVAGDDVIG